MLSHLPDEELSVAPTGADQPREVAAAVSADDLDDEPLPDDPWEAGGETAREPAGYLDMSAIRAKAARRASAE
ncbi:hypothetical protein SDC9_212317 [bioreactor metagenome]|uniref:Uncharacterized protein n=1 Tax=bioreactor metagenome TaxID=1076179 RepID=A0A645JML6_9ZZZZ